MRQPCEKKCPNRTGTCHAECEKFLEYDSWNRTKRKERDKERKIHDYISDSVQANKRGKR